MRARANQCIYWPGLNLSIKQYKETCIECQRNAPPQQNEPIILTKSPDYPFQQICMDYFFIEERPYFVTADRFSGWPCIYDFKDNHTPRNVLINICRELFINYVVPEEINSDGGPQFTSSSFQIFMKNWGIKHRLSSAYYPQSNGRAESAVKTAKQII